LHTTELKDDAGIRLLVLMIICISLAALYARLQVVVDVWAALRCHRCAVTLDVMPVCRLSSPGVRLVRCCSVLILMWCTTWTWITQTAGINQSVHYSIQFNQSISFLVWR